MIYMGVKTKDHKEVNGTFVENKGDGNIQTHLGVKSMPLIFLHQIKISKRISTICRTELDTQQERF